MAAAAPIYNLSQMDVIIHGRRKRSLLDVLEKKKRRTFFRYEDKWRVGSITDRQCRVSICFYSSIELRGLCTPALETHISQQFLFISLSRRASLIFDCSQTNYMMFILYLFALLCCPIVSPLLRLRPSTFPPLLISWRNAVALHIVRDSFVFVSRLFTFCCRLHAHLVLSPNWKDNFV